MRQYRGTHQACEPYLAGKRIDKADQGDQVGYIDMALHRRLCQAVDNPLLDGLYTRSNCALRSLEKYYTKGHDYGARYFFHATKPTPTLPYYSSRIKLILYITQIAPKLKLLAKMVHQVCNKNQHKLLIFTNWPTVQWQVELFLFLLNFNVVSIRAQHKASERNDCVNSFTDPISNVQVLVISLRTSSTALNLQNDCSDVVFFDCPSNTQIMLQASGCMLRIGQTRICNMWVLTTDHIYNQVLQWRSTNNMIRILAAQAAIDVTLADVHHWKALHPEENLVDSSPSVDQMQADIITIKCAALVTKMFSQRSSRHSPEWGAARDVTMKDQIREEQLFRTFKQLKTNTLMKSKEIKGKVRPLVICRQQGARLILFNTPRPPPSMRQDTWGIEAN